jgi:hypothetical protein
MFKMDALFSQTPCMIQQTKLPQILQLKNSSESSFNTDFSKVDYLTVL